MLRSVDCEVATMMFVGGQEVTVGTPKGKKFLQTHPAIISSFNAYFLYGEHPDTLTFYLGYYY